MMNKLLVFDTNTNPTKKYYEKLSHEDKKIVDRFEANCKITASISRAKKAKSNAIRFLVMANKKVESINLQDLKDFLLKLKEAKFSDYTNNDIKNYVQRFLKEQFRDWSERFNNFEDIKYDSEPSRKEKISPEDVLTKEQVEKLIKTESDLIWKTFLVVQYEGALRTGETRQLLWSQIDMKDLEVYWLTITSKKNRQGKGKDRIAPPLSQAVFFLNELKKAQQEQGIKSLYVFPAKHKLNMPISSGMVNKWFSRLTKKVLGKAKTNYLLRHSKGESFHVLVRDNKMSKENATQMMGHSEKMFDKTYSHTDKKLLKETLKKQVLDIDYISPEKKSELEKKVEELIKENIEIKKEGIETRRLLNQVLRQGTEVIGKI